MKYLLIAMMIDAAGEASAIYPPSWHDDEAACATRGEDFRSWALNERAGKAEAAYFDCLALTRLEIVIMSEMIPYKIPQVPQ